MVPVFVWVEISLLLFGVLLGTGAGGLVVFFRFLRRGSIIWRRKFSGGRGNGFRGGEAADEAEEGYTGVVSPAG